MYRGTTSEKIFSKYLKHETLNAQSLNALVFICSTLANVNCVFQKSGLIAHRQLKACQHLAEQ